MAQERRGVVYGVMAYLLWGVFPLYWPLLAPSTAVEILAHRVPWSLLFVAGVLTVRRRWTWIRDLGWRRLGLLSIAAVIIAVNWGAYIYGVNAGFVVETALGYFINPLVTVGLGVLVLGESLRAGQKVALALAAVAVVLLTIDYGRPPWIALLLAVTFAVYGLLKKTTGVGATESLAVETAVLLPPAVGFLVLQATNGTATFGTLGLRHAVLLSASGVVTAIPLLCFGAAARRVPLTTIGLLQYIAPTAQFVIGVLVYDERMPASRWMGFALVWTALLLLTADGLRSARRRQLARAAGSLA